MMDALLILGIVEGSCFTRRKNHGGWLDQSHIDRMYISGLGWWPHQFILLKHIQMQGISDHDLVTLPMAILDLGGNHIRVKN